MKKTLLLFVIAFVPFASGNAGFKNHSEKAVMAVADVKKLGDDRTVIMKGSIEKHISKDKYQFVDNTGKVVVEIDGDKWRGAEVGSDNTIMIVGETDKNWFGDIHVDVDSIQVLN